MFRSLVALVQIAALASFVTSARTSSQSLPKPDAAVTAHRESVVKRRELVRRELRAGQDRLEQIATEVASSHLPDWAGLYMCGTECDRWTLAVAPRGGFVYLHSGCTTSDVHYGSVAFVDDERVELDLARDPQCDLPHAHPFERATHFPTIWWRVRWGDARFLVPERALLDFCNDVNAGWVPRYLDWMEKTEPGRTRPDFRVGSGLPEVPAAYRQYLVTRAIVARVLTVGARANPSATVRRDVRHAEGTVLHGQVDAGAVEGLRSGMTLWLDDPWTCWECTVIAVDPHRAIIAFRCWRPTDGLPDSPSVCARLSTRKPRAR